MDINKIVEILRKADDAYFNLGEPIMSDSEYDNLREFLKNEDPSHPYLMSVGSPTRGEPTRLSKPMPSLNQLHTDGDIRNWGKRFDIGDVIIMDKMDGVSVRLIYDAEIGFKSAFSRGDALEGSDITRHINPNRIKFPNIKQDLMIRAEVEISNSSHKKLIEDGVITYKTPLSSMSGIINRKEIVDQKVYDEIKIFGFSVEYGKEFENKEEELKWLGEQGFDVPFYSKHALSSLTSEQLNEEIKKRKASHDFGMDGIVLYMNDNKARAKIEAGVKDGDNPRGVVKFKVRDEGNTADIEVVDVEWQISKHGVFKPTVVFNPVMINGFTISRATGFNAKFIVENKIGVGTQAKITRSGDVIPYIYEVTKGTKELLPTDAFEWSESGVDIISMGETREQIINKLEAFSVGIGIDGLREGTITKLYDMCGIKTFSDLIKVNKAQLIASAGSKNAEKIMISMKERLSSIELATLMGSTTFFGSGIGVRMVSKITEELGDDFQNWTFDNISKVEGFSEINARKIIDGLNDFITFYNEISDMVTLSEPGKSVHNGIMEGQFICFTGVRDRNLEKYITSNGGKLQSSVNKKTTKLVYKGTSSSKYKKAIELQSNGQNLDILSVDEFWEEINDAT